MTEELKQFKLRVKNKIADKKTTIDAASGERSSYITHISDRLDFIYYILSGVESEEVNLTYDLLSSIWDIIVNEALIQEEPDVIYKWIKATAESKQGFPMSIEDLLKFFNQKMNASQNASNMTADGFACFKNLFLIINEKLNRITKVGGGSGSGPNVVSYGATVSGGTVY